MPLMSVYLQWERILPSPYLHRILRSSIKKPRNFAHKANKNITTLPPAPFLCR